MEGFTVTVQVASPVALGALPYAPTLDSVILGVISGGQILGGASGDDALRELSEALATYDGVPAASALWPLATPTRSAVVHPRSTSDELIDHWSSGKYNTSFGPYVSKFTRLSLAATSIWEWSGEGDIERLAGLLARVDSIGARRGSGYGAATQIQIRPDPNPCWRARGLGPYRIGRPVPIDRIDSFLGEDGISASDLDPDHHAVVALPRWPAPSWSGVDPVPTMIPILE